MPTVQPNVQDLFRQLLSPKRQDRPHARELVRLFGDFIEAGSFWQSYD
jgi:hypothetical protein